MVSVAVLINLAAHPAKEENQQNAERTSKTHLDNAFLLQRVQRLCWNQRDRTRAHENLRRLAGSWSQTEDRFSLYREQIIQTVTETNKTESSAGSLQEPRLLQNYQ